MTVDELIAELENYEETWPTGDDVEVSVVLWDGDDELSITGLTWREDHLVLDVRKA